MNKRRKKALMKENSIKTFPRKFLGNGEVDVLPIKEREGRVGWGFDRTHPSLVLGSAPPVTSACRSISTCTASKRVEPCKRQGIRQRTGRKHRPMSARHGAAIGRARGGGGTHKSIRNPSLQRHARIDRATISASSRRLHSREFLDVLLEQVSTGATQEQL